MLPVPQPTQTPGQTARFYYGWVIVAVCSLSLLVVFGIRLSFAVFFVALIDTFGWPRASASLIFSANMVVFALSSTSAGMALDRWGVRRVFGLGAALIALGLFFSSRVNSLGQMLLTYGLIAGLGITILGLGMQAGVVVRWFQRRRGVALGLTFAGTGLGTLLLTPGAEYLINRVGWREAYLVLAGLALLLIPLVVFFLRLEPHQKGLRLADVGEALPPSPGLRSSYDQQWTFQRVARMPAFWLIILAGLGAIGPLRMLTVHQLAALDDIGFDRLFSASIVGSSGAVTALSFVLFGALSDRIGRRASYALGSICLTGAIAILSGLTRPDQGGWLLLYALLLGLGEGSRASLITAVASDLFPGPALGAINGAVGASFGAGAAVFPWVAGRIFDQRQSYGQAYLVAVLGVLLSTLALWLAPMAAGRRAAGRPVKAGLNDDRMGG